MAFITVKMAEWFEHSTSEGPFGYRPSTVEMEYSTEFVSTIVPLTRCEVGNELYYQHLLRLTMSNGDSFIIVKD
jgi:hypothetical protein